MIYCPKIKKSLLPLDLISFKTWKVILDCLFLNSSFVFVSYRKINLHLFLFLIEKSVF